MKLTAIILGSIYAFYILWVAYLAIMNLKGARDAGTLTNFTYYFSMPLLISGFVLDVAINWIVGTVIFLDLPREMTLSHRLERYMGDDNWRESIALWMARNLLDFADPRGYHIDQSKGD